jgi:hypothetical protein
MDIKDNLLGNYFSLTVTTIYQHQSLIAPQFNNRILNLKLLM